MLWTLDRDVFVQVHYPTHWWYPNRESHIHFPAWQMANYKNLFYEIQTTYLWCFSKWWYDFTCCMRWRKTKEKLLFCYRRQQETSPAYARASWLLCPQQRSSGHPPLETLWGPLLCFSLDVSTADGNLQNWEHISLYCSRVKHLCFYCI